MTKLTVAFRNFAKAPENTLKCIYFTTTYTHGLKCTHIMKDGKDYNLYLNKWDV